MATETKLPVTKTPTEPMFGQAWRPFETLRKEMDRLFDEFGEDFWRRPVRSLAAFERSWPRKFAAAPVVDVAETDTAYEITAELPGMDEKNIEVKLANNSLTIKGEKRDEKEETKKDYYMRERSFGSFQRSFTVPEGVDTDKIEASFKKGVLTVTLPKTVEAKKAEKKITVKVA